MKVTREAVQELLDRWQPVLKLADWAIDIHIVQGPWRKSGDIKVLSDTRSAVLMVHQNPELQDLERLVVHELLHLKLWGMDQMIEELIGLLYGVDETDPKRAFAYTRFMGELESTVSDLDRALLELGGRGERDLVGGRLRREVEEEIRPGEG